MSILRDREHAGADAAAFHVIEHRLIERYEIGHGDAGGRQRVCRRHGDPEIARVLRRRGIVDADVDGLDLLHVRRRRRVIDLLRAFRIDNRQPAARRQQFPLIDAAAAAHFQRQLSARFNRSRVAGDDEIGPAAIGTGESSIAAAGDIAVAVQERRALVQTDIAPRDRPELADAVGAAFVSHRTQLARDACIPGIARALRRPGDGDAAPVVRARPIAAAGARRRRCRGGSDNDEQTHDPHTRPRTSIHDGHLPRRK